MHADRQAAHDSHVATVDAFYVRVMHRVCSLYRKETESPSDEVLARLQQVYPSLLQSFGWSPHEV